MGIDIDVRGHTGAIGLKHSGSQGCTLQDSTIYAEGAFSGLYNCPGQAAGTYNVEVIGGNYEFYADSQSRFPILVGCTFRNQGRAAIGYAKGGTQVPTLLVGCMYGNVKGLSSDRAMLEVMNSSNVMVAQLKAFFPSAFPHIRETIGDQTHSIPSSKICALHLRD